MTLHPAHSALVAALLLNCCAPPPAPASAGGASPGPSAPGPRAEPASLSPARSGHHGHHGSPASHQPPTASHRFDDVAHWVGVFDDPKRDEWQRPDEVVRELALAADDWVADLGAGTGYFLGPLSRAVPQGKVIAIDVEPKLVEHIRKRVADAGVKNVEAILADQDDPKLPNGVKVLLLVDTYHHIGDRSAYFRRVRGKLAAGGRVVVVDFKKGQFPVGPPDDHKLAPEVVEREMKSAGYGRCRSYDGLPYQYLLVFSERC